MIKVAKLNKAIFSAAKPLVMALTAKKPSVAHITFAAQKSLPGLIDASHQARSAVVSAHLASNSRVFRQTADTVDQMVEGAKIIARTPPNEVMATFDIDEAVAYRYGIQLFVEAFSSLSE